MTFTKERVKNMANVNQLFQLKRLAERHGSYFFSRDSMRFFQSRIHDVVYGGCVFVTSEKQSPCYGRTYPRLYTVRYMDSTGNTHTIGEFQGFDTRSKAHTFAYNVGIEIEQIRLTTYGR